MASYNTQCSPTPSSHPHEKSQGSEIVKRTAMFHHASGRNHRPKGSNVKKILQVVVLLAVACWLLYQVKHSRDKKIENAGNDERKLSKGGEELYLGRKGDAGSENVIIIDTNAQGSDESTEIKQDAIHHDSSNLNNEDKSKEIPHNHELEDSNESNSNNGEKESTQEEHDDSLVNDGEETLQLPSERERDTSADQNDNSNEEGHALEEVERLKENGKIAKVRSDWTVGDNVKATMTGEETTSGSADQTISSENAGKKNERENGEASNQEVVSVDDETLKGEGDGSDDEIIKSLSENSDDNKSDHADGGARFDLDDRIRVSSSQDDATSTNDQANDLFHAGDSLEFKSDTSLQNDNEASKEGDETQLGNTSEVENTDNNSSGEIKIDGESKNEIENSSSNTEVQNSNGSSSIVSVEESQPDEKSSTDGAMNVNDGQETSSDANNNEVAELQANNDDAKVETDSQRRDAGEAGNSENNSVESIEEIEKSSEGTEQSGSDNPKKEITAGDKNGKSNDVTGSDPGNEIAGTGNEDPTVIEEGKDEAASSEAITSSEVNEKINLDDSTNEIPSGEVAQAVGGNNSEAEGTNDINTEELKTEQRSNIETKQDNTNSSAEGEASEGKAVQ